MIFSVAEIYTNAMLQDTVDEQPDIANISSNRGYEAVGGLSDRI